MCIRDSGCASATRAHAPRAGARLPGPGALPVSPLTPVPSARYRGYKHCKRIPLSPSQCISVVGTGRDHTRAHSCFQGRAPRCAQTGVSERSGSWSTHTSSLGSPNAAACAAGRPGVAVVPLQSWYHCNFLRSGPVVDAPHDFALTDSWHADSAASRQESEGGRLSLSTPPPRRGRYIFALNAMQLNLFPYVLGLTGPVGALRTTGEGGPPRAQPSPPPRRVVATGRRCAGRRSPRARPSAGRRCGGARAAHGAGRG